MSKITLLVYAFACKQLTNFVSNGQPNDPCPRLPFGGMLFILFSCLSQQSDNILAFRLSPIAALPRNTL